MLSQRTKYGLRALIALAGAPKGQIVQIQEIADRQNVPKKFLELIMLDLKRHGFVFSQRGLGFYGELSRFELLGLVAVVWALILAWSAPWLDRFRYGPFEWLWRSLVRMRPQPMTREPVATA